MDPRSPLALDFDVAVAFRGLDGDAKAYESAEKKAEKAEEDAGQGREHPGGKYAEDLMGVRRH